MFQDTQEWTPSKKCQSPKSSRGRSDLFGAECPCSLIQVRLQGAKSMIRKGVSTRSTKWLSLAYICLPQVYQLLKQLQQQGARVQSISCRDTAHQTMTSFMFTFILVHDNPMLRHHGKARTTTSLPFLTRI